MTDQDALLANEHCKALGPDPSVGLIRRKPDGRDIGCMPDEGAKPTAAGMHDVAQGVGIGAEHMLESMSQVAFLETTYLWTMLV